VGFVVFLLPVAIGQQPWKPKVKEGIAYFPGEIHLLTGFKVETRSGIEYPSGKIWKDNFIIDFNVGGTPGYEADPIQWQQEQVVNGHRVVCSFNKTDHLLLTYPYLKSSFHAKIDNQQELTEMLMMALTFERPGLSAEPQTDSR
jgi:hypothetical protein